MMLLDCWQIQMQIKYYCLHSYYINMYTLVTHYTRNSLHMTTHQIFLIHRHNLCTILTTIYLYQLLLNVNCVNTLTCKTGNQNKV